MTPKPRSTTSSLLNKVRNKDWFLLGPEPVAVARSVNGHHLAITAELGATGGAPHVVDEQNGCIYLTRN